MSILERPTLRPRPVGALLVPGSPGNKGERALDGKKNACPTPDVNNVRVTEFRRHGPFMPQQSQKSGLLVRRVSLPLGAVGTCQ